MQRLILLLALAIMAVIPATAMATTTETLPATTTTTSGSVYCPTPVHNGTMRAVGVNFTGTGTAQGSYPGSFSETRGIVRLQGNYGPLGSGIFSTYFTITSPDAQGKITTIKGTITRRPLFGTYACGSGGGSVWFSGPNGQTAIYTATITAPNGSQQTISNGVANVVSGNMSTPQGSQGSLLTTLTLP